MHLTRQTDYALRLLIALAETNDTRLQIAEIADAQAISRSHLMKIANKLAHAGYVDAQRGRGGGIRLGRNPATINIGEVVRLMEPGCGLVACSSCQLRRACSLPAALDQAAQAFDRVLARYTLADILREPAQPAAAA
jgi:Rrf2 family transcriptional regulator, nitric oxide-sensitive transcriptional repressor